MSVKTIDDVRSTSSVVINFENEKTDFVDSQHEEKGLFGGRALLVPSVLIVAIPLVLAIVTSTLVSLKYVNRHADMELELLRGACAKDGALYFHNHIYFFTNAHMRKFNLTASYNVRAGIEHLYAAFEEYTARCVRPSLLGQDTASWSAAYDDITQLYQKVWNRTHEFPYVSEHSDDSSAGAVLAGQEAATGNSILAGFRLFRSLLVSNAFFDYFGSLEAHMQVLLYEFQLFNGLLWHSGETLISSHMQILEVYGLHEAATLQRAHSKWYTEICAVRSTLCDEFEEYSHELHEYIEHAFIERPHSDISNHTLPEGMVVSASEELEGSIDVFRTAVVDYYPEVQEVIKDDEGFQHLLFYVVVLSCGLAVFCSAMAAWYTLTSVHDRDMYLKMNIIRRQRLERVLWKFFPKEFLTLLRISRTQGIQSGIRRHVGITVLVADIRRFTDISEELGPLRTFHWLQKYLTNVYPCINSYDGFVDKTLGDGITAIFTNPAMAIRCALEMQSISAQLNESQLGFSGGSDSAKKMPRYNVGIGIHSGTAIIGLIGDKRRLSAHIVSPVTIMAAKLEGLCKNLHAPVLCSVAVKEEIEKYASPSFDTVSILPMGKHKLRSFPETIEVFEVLDRALNQERFHCRSLLAPYIERFMRGSLSKEEAMSEYVTELTAFRKAYINRQLESDDVDASDVDPEECMNRMRDTLQYILDNAD